MTCNYRRKLRGKSIGRQPAADRQTDKPWRFNNRICPVLQFCCINMSLRSSLIVVLNCLACQDSEETGKPRKITYGRSLPTLQYLFLCTILFRNAQKMIYFIIIMYYLARYYYKLNEVLYHCVGTKVLLFC